MNTENVSPSEKEAHRRDEPEPSLLEQLKSVLPTVWTPVIRGDALELQDAPRVSQWRPVICLVSDGVSAEAMHLLLDLLESWGLRVWFIKFHKCNEYRALWHDANLETPQDREEGTHWRDGATRIEAVVRAVIEAAKHRKENQGG